VTVTAISQANTAKTASATITLAAAPAISVSVAPSTASVKTGQTQQFTATVSSDSQNKGVIWQVNSVASGNTTNGTISAAGLYTAPASVPTPAAVTITAISVADTTKSATATVTVTSSSAPTPTVTLTASPATINSGSSSTLTWSSTNATTCTASGSWSGSKATSGTQSVSPTATSSYTLTCTGTGGSANATATVTVTTGSASVPGAPTQLTAYATTEGAYVIFAAPSNNGGSALTQYTATANPGGITATTTAITTPAAGLSARVDLNGLTPGTSYTFTVTASNANGTGPASVASNSITPTAYAPYWVADGGSLTGENPLWGDYSYGGNIYYGTTPGTHPRNGFPSTSYAAPNPPTPGTNVIEFDTTGAPQGYGGGVQPFAKHTPNQGAGNGRFNLAPYTYLTVSIWPTVSGQDILSYFEKSIWFNGVATGGGNFSLTDATQNWPVNQFAGWEFNDNTSGNDGTGIASSTATVITLSGGDGSLNKAGDYYELQEPDHSVGQSVNSILAYGPNPMVVGQWNTYNIPLTAYNSSTNGNVAGELVLKFGLQSQGAPGPDTFYIANLGFTNSTVPAVNLSANPATIASGGSSTLTWSSTNATSCTASGGWTGAKATSGTATVSPTSTATYTLTCTGTGGTGSASQIVTVSGIGGSPAPTVTLTANPTTISSGGSSTLTWSSTNATSCTASGSWSGSESIIGSQSVSPAATSSYTLTCIGTGGSANSTATVTVNSGTNVPSAPTNVTAFATTTGVYVLFAPPANAGSLALTKYTATTNTGFSASVVRLRIQNEGNTLNYMQLNARVDINGIPSGTPVTVTVTATNASGTSPASAPSNQVTPIAYAPVYVADGGGYTAESPSWGDYSYSGFPIYGVQPGIPSSNGTGSYPAPSNPISAAYNVAEFDNPNSNGGFQPYFHHQNPNNNQNGRLNLSPYTDLVISVWPTANQSSFQQALNVGVLKCLWVNGVISSSGSTTLTDTTQNWPSNIFVGALVTDITNGNLVNIASNTSNTLTFDKSMPMNPGDYYEISVPDIGIGQEVIVGNGTATSYGPTNLVSGQWNTYTIPLTAFNGGSTSYPNVAEDQILKFNVVLSSNSTEVHYFSNVQFK